MPEPRQALHCLIFCLFSLVNGPVSALKHASACLCFWGLGYIDPINTQGERPRALVGATEAAFPRLVRLQCPSCVTGPGLWGAMAPGPAAPRPGPGVVHRVAEVSHAQEQPKGFYQQPSGCAALVEVTQGFWTLPLELCFTHTHTR